MLIYSRCLALRSPIVDLIMVPIEIDINNAISMIYLENQHKMTVYMNPVEVLKRLSQKFISMMRILADFLDLFMDYL